MYAFIRFFLLTSFVNDILSVCRTVAEAADTPYKYVVVLTKCLPDVLPTSVLLEPLLAPSYVSLCASTSPVFVLVQNGLGIEVDLYAALEKQHQGNGKGRIISAAVFILANAGEKGDWVQHGNDVSTASPVRSDCSIGRPRTNPSRKHMSWGYTVQDPSPGRRTRLTRNARLRGSLKSYVSSQLHLILHDECIVLTLTGTRSICLPNLFRIV